jgi:lipid-A-disaccharide synthase-like uncharacterized protein
METTLLYFPYSAISISILARFIFFFLLYKNKSTNSYSLAFCILNICSSGLWTYYSFSIKDTSMVARSATEIGLLTISSAYIIYNKIKAIKRANAVLP